MPERLDLTGLCPPPSSVAVVSDGEFVPVRSSVFLRRCGQQRRSTGQSLMYLQSTSAYDRFFPYSNPPARLLYILRLTIYSGWDIAKLYLSAWCRRKQSFSPASLFVKHQRSNGKCLPTTLSRIEESVQSGVDVDLPRIQETVKHFVSIFVSGPVSGESDAHQSVFFV